MSTETWCPFATAQPGPANKQGYASFPKRRLWDIQFVVGHSMEGSLGAALGELMRPDRQASWTFSNPKVGPLLQHYPLESVTWTSGSVNANFLGIGIENEGVAGELLNANQRKNFADLLTWLSWAVPTLEKWERGTTLKEHKEMVEYGSPPTACPSNRIPWAQILALMEDDMPLNDADKAEIRAIVKEEIGKAFGQAFYDLVAVRIAQLLDARNKAAEGVVVYPDG